MSSRVSLRPFHALIVTLLAYSALTLMMLAVQGSDISLFITAGDSFTDASGTPSPIRVLQDSDGYDGQFYYRLALDPFTGDETAFGIRFDHPSFRQNRIGYPFLAWMLSLGRPSLVPWTLVLVNLLALGGITLLGSHISSGSGRSPLWGCLFAFYPGFVVSYCRNLAEITAAFWVLLALMLFTKRRHILSALAFCAAVLTRETTLIAAGGAGLALFYDWVRKRSPGSGRWPVMLLPLLVYLSWNAFLRSHWGVSPVSGGLKDLGPPLAGILEFLVENIGRPSGVGLVSLLFMVFCLGMLALAGLCLKRSRAGLEAKLGWATYGLLVISLSAVLWYSFYEFLRAFNEAFLLSMVIVTFSSAGRAVSRILPPVVLASWVILAAYFIR